MPFWAFYWAGSYDVTFSLRKQNSVFFVNIEHRVLADVLLKNFVAAADVLLKNFVAAAVFSVSYFSMLLKNFVAAYQSLREACAISGPCTSTRTWSVFHCSPYLSQLTRCGRIQNKPSSVAWRPLSQLTHCGLKTNKPSSVPWRPLSQLTRCGRKRNEPSSVTWRPFSQLTRSNLKTNEVSRC